MSVNLMCNTIVMVIINKSTYANRMSNTCQSWGWMLLTFIFSLLLWPRIIDYEIWTRPQKSLHLRSMKSSQWLDRCIKTTWEGYWLYKCQSPTADYFDFLHLQWHLGPYVFSKLSKRFWYKAKFRNHCSASIL